MVTREWFLRYDSLWNGIHALKDTPSNFHPNNFSKPDLRTEILAIVQTKKKCILIGKPPIGTVPAQKHNRHTPNITSHIKYRQLAP